MAWRAWLPTNGPRPWQSILLGGAFGGMAVAVRLAIAGPLGRELPFITFFPALILASALGGFIGGLSCLAVTTLAAVFLFMPPDASAPWAVGAFCLAGGLIVAVAAALTDSVRELRRSQGRFTEAQTQLQTLVGELAHRNRNALFVIMSIVSQSAREAQSAAEAERIINGRLEALLRAQDVVVQSAGGSAALRLLLDKALEPFGPDRFAIAAGPDVVVDSDVGTGLGLLFHELATNALKYGALSAPAGRVLVGWTVDGGLARFTWREVGGPAVTPPSKEGFGARLLAVALVPQGGRVERHFEPDGLICELYIPVPLDPSRPSASTPPGARMAGTLAAVPQRQEP